MRDELDQRVDALNEMLAEGARQRSRAR